MSKVRKISVFTHFLRNSVESIGTISPCSKNALFLSISYQTFSLMRKKCVKVVLYPNKLKNRFFLRQDSRILSPLHPSPAVGHAAIPLETVRRTVSQDAGPSCLSNRALLRGHLSDWIKSANLALKIPNSSICLGIDIFRSDDGSSSPIACFAPLIDNLPCNPYSARKAK